MIYYKLSSDFNQGHASSRDHIKGSLMVYYLYEMLNRYACERNEDLKKIFEMVIILIKKLVFIFFFLKNLNYFR